MLLLDADNCSLIIHDSLTFIISIWNMDSPQMMNFLQRCSHLKSQWSYLHSDSEQNQHAVYQHRYSSDQSEAVRLNSVTMKDLDQYSSRQAYNYPFCPIIYKYIIQKNWEKGNELMFDIVLLVQKVSQRLDNANMKRCPRMMRSLTAKVSDIVIGFEYLFRRFGAFAIKEEMIGWTQLGMIKVWVNQDYSINSKSESAQNEETMVEQLIKILQDKSIVKKTIKKSESFQSLLNNIESSQEKKQIDYVKKHVAFRPIDNLNASLNDYKPNFKAEKIQNCLNSPQSRKNITFSYSNKDLNKLNGAKQNLKQSAKFPASKRCSIQLDPNQLSHFMLRSPVSNECSGLTIGPKTPTVSISSNKALNPPSFVRSQKKKLSYFNDEASQEYQSSNDEKMTISKFKEQFSKTTQSSLNRKQGTGLEIVSKNYKAAPESLHYSTSSNPLSKFFRPKRNEQKAYSSIGGHNRQDQSYLEQKSKNGSNQSQPSQKTTDIKLKEETKGILQTFKIEQQQANLRQSQEVQKDLDALFNSSNSFNYDELQTELDGIL